MDLSGGASIYIYMCNKKDYMHIQICVCIYIYMCTQTRNHTHIQQEYRPSETM